MTCILAISAMGVVIMYARGTMNACCAPKSETVENSCRVIPDTMNSIATMTLDIVHPGDIGEVCPLCCLVDVKDTLVKLSKKPVFPSVFSMCIAGAANRISDAPANMLKA